MDASVEHFGSKSERELEKTCFQLLIIELCSKERELKNIIREIQTYESDFCIHNNYISISADTGAICISLLMSSYAANIARWNAIPMTRESPNAVSGTKVSSCVLAPRN